MLEDDTAKRLSAHAALALTQGVEAAERALAEGHLVEAGKQLSAIDALLHGGAHAGALRARIDRLHGEVARLKGWQHWGGRLARDELVAQAEALASAGPDASDAQIARLTPRQRAELITEMRARWKELDRVGGGASNRALWERFDAALNTAYEPVAAQAKAQREARTQNLQARLGLLTGLEAAALPDAAAPPSNVDWKPVAAALGNFHIAWRKLGPLEHTVPRSECGAVRARLDAAVARLDGPLTAARRVAHTERERLIARAQALTAQGSAAVHGREGLDKLRALQAEWQEMAKGLPLARAAENALWSEFRSAIDLAHGARNAAFDARDAEFKAHGAARNALIARLEAMDDTTFGGRTAAHRCRCRIGMAAGRRGTARGRCRTRCTLSRCQRRRASTTCGRLAARVARPLRCIAGAAGRSGAASAARPSRSR